MKRFLSFMMALALLFSMSVNAFAADGEEGTTPVYETGTGSITITNATKGHNYSIYKIFDATFAVDDENNVLTNDAGERIIAYTISTDNQFFDYMFGAGENQYFKYNSTTGVVTLKDNVNETNMFAYLKTMVEAKKADNTSYKAVESKTADSQTVVFENLPYGYYLIHKGTEAVVTVNSNTPDVEVIDKNQKVGELEKWIWDEDYVNPDESIGKWVKNTSANIDDVEEFKIEFEATNYNGEFPVLYYTVNDNNNNALWINIDENIKVKVGETVLAKGYYYNAVTKTGKQLGTWGSETDVNKAQYYFIQTDSEHFEIVIPWMSGYTVSFENGFSITVDPKSDFNYDATVNVLINYNATVEHNADINGAGEDNISNLKNTAKLQWTTTEGPGEGPEKNTDIIVYALGLNKIEAGTEDAPVFLAGAEFAVYRDAECTSNPVYVIPTDIDNVYILDDFGVVEKGMQSVRTRYEKEMKEYLGENYATTQKNVVTTDAEGKIVIIGLEDGTYYLKETKAPDGYNLLPGNTPIKVGTGATKTEEFFGYEASSVTIGNNKGIELPSTGGEGTMRMITIGSIVAIAFAVLLITNKKMSVYQD